MPHLSGSSVDQTGTTDIEAMDSVSESGTDQTEVEVPDSGEAILAEPLSGTLLDPINPSADDQKLLTRCDNAFAHQLSGVLVSIGGPIFFTEYYKGHTQLESPAIVSLILVIVAIMILRVNNPDNSQRHLHGCGGGGTDKFAEGIIGGTALLWTALLFLKSPTEQDEVEIPHKIEGPLLQ